MKQVASILTISFFCILLSACGDKEKASSSSNDHLGEVTVTVDGKQYVLPVQVCDSPTLGKSMDGNMEETFSIWAFDGFENDERTYPTFYMGGEKLEDGRSSVDFSLTLGDTNKGGKEFDGKMPYEDFTNTNFHYKGVIHPFPSQSEDDGLPIKIELNCEDKREK